jgi:integrator complex subunit 3
MLVLWEILCTPTPKMYLTLRITPEIESQLLFVLENVKSSNQKRYQQWFHAQHLSSVETEPLIIDLVRFICCVFHPSNAIIGSDVVQRWTFIGWLLKCIKTNYIASSVKLALFYDWLFFDASSVSIMNIEPGILIIVHSLVKYPNITNTLIEFLWLIARDYYPEKADAILGNVEKAMQEALNKGVVGYT